MGVSTLYGWFGLVYGVKRHFQQYFSYIVAVDNYRLIHGLFHIALVISTRPDDKHNMKKTMY